MATGGVVGAVESVEVAARVSPALAEQSDSDEHGKPRRTRDESRSHGRFSRQVGHETQPLEGSIVNSTTSSSLSTNGTTEKTGVLRYAPAGESCQVNAVPANSSNHVMSCG